MFRTLEEHAERFHGKSASLVVRLVRFKALVIGSVLVIGSAVIRSHELGVSNHPIPSGHIQTRRSAKLETFAWHRDETNFKQEVRNGIT